MYDHSDSLMSVSVFIKIIKSTVDFNESNANVNTIYEIYRFTCKVLTSIYKIKISTCQSRQMSSNQLVNDMKESIKLLQKGIWKVEESLEEEYKRGKSA